MQNQTLHPNSTQLYFLLKQNPGKNVILFFPCVTPWVCGVFLQMEAETPIFLLNNSA